MVVCLYLNYFIIKYSQIFNIIKKTKSNENPPNKINFHSTKLQNSQLTCIKNDIWPNTTSAERKITNWKRTLTMRIFFMSTMLIRMVWETASHLVGICMMSYQRAYCLLSSTILHSRKHVMKCECDANS